MKRLLDDHLPHWDERDRHTLAVRAAPEDAWLALRGLPARLSRRRAPVPVGAGPLLDGMLAMGFVALGERDGRELALGVVGRFWKLRGNVGRVADAAAFDAFAEPGFARAAVDLRVEPAPGGALVSTETRILATDPVARRRFRRYWRVVRPGSALTRVVMLRAIRRHAERLSRARPRR